MTLSLPRDFMLVGTSMPQPGLAALPCRFASGNWLRVGGVHSLMLGPLAVRVKAGLGGAFDAGRRCGEADWGNVGHICMKHHLSRPVCMHGPRQFRNHMLIAALDLASMFENMIQACWARCPVHLYTSDFCGGPSIPNCLALHWFLFLYPSSPSAITIPYPTRPLSAVAYLGAKLCCWNR